MSPPPGADPLAPFLLASASPRRKDILGRLGFAFDVRPADVDETPAPGLEPRAVAMELALKKARAGGKGLVAGTVIGADTVVSTARGLLGKPEDAAAARAFLETLSGTSHEVITGIALLHAPTGCESVDAATTRVTMRAMAPEEIEAYVRSGEPFGKAGGYAIQETGDKFVTGLRGSFDNVVGFPSELFLEMLPKLRDQVERAARRSEDA